MVGKVDTRLLVAIGFSVLSLSLFYMSNVIDMQMGFRTAVELRMFQSVGMAFLFVPIQTISYAGVPPEKYNQVSGIMNLSRNMGGDIGIAFVTTLILRRAQLHQLNLSGRVTPYDPRTPVDRRADRPGPPARGLGLGQRRPPGERGALPSIAAAGDSTRLPRRAASARHRERDHGARRVAGAQAATRGCGPRGALEDALRADVWSSRPGEGP